MEQVHIEDFKGITQIEHLIKDLKNSKNLSLKNKNCIKVYEEWNIEEKINNYMKDFIKLKNRIKIIQDKVTRSTTKLYFFGKMSSGKTRLINGIIGDDLFESAQDHTTTCFVNIRKSDNENFKLIHKGKNIFNFRDKDETIKEVKKLSTENNGKQLTESEFIEVLIPIENDNKILTGNVELIDSPGSGNQDKITECIKTYATDADIFIFVVMHVITDDDKRFFRFQLENSTKPDIYFLINKWDDSDDHREDIIQKKLIEKCKQHILEMSGSDIKNNNRIYFISAKELFHIRINKNNNYLITENQKARYDEFLRFEEEISKYIQNSVYRKFERYKNEITRLKTELNDSFCEFKKLIFENDNGKILKSFEDSKQRLFEYKENKLKECDKMKSKFTKKIKNSVTKMLNFTNLDNEELLKKQIKDYYSKINEDIEKFNQILTEETSKFVMERELELNLCFDQINGEQINLTKIEYLDENWPIVKNEESQFTKSGGDVVLMHINSKTIKENRGIFYSTYEVEGTSKTAILCLPTIQGKSNNSFVPNGKILDKLNKNLHENDNEKLKILDENFNNIKISFTRSVDDKIKRIENEIQLRNDYEKYVEKNFKKYNPS